MAPGKQTLLKSSFTRSPQLRPQLCAALQCDQTVLIQAASQSSSSTDADDLGFVQHDADCSHVAGQNRQLHLRNIC